MSKLIDELKEYKEVYSSFSSYIVKTHKLDAEAFFNKASNAQLIPQAINYLEDRGDHDFLDALCYVNFYTKNTLGVNDLIKKTIKTVFYLIEKKQPLDFMPF